MSPSEVNLDSTEVADDAPPSPALRTRRGRFVLNGDPVILIAVGPISVRPDRTTEARALIDRLAELSTAEVRFWVRIETWSFCFEEGASAPWAKAGQTYDLGRFDPGFWGWAAEIAGYADERGVLVEFVLFDGAALKAGPGRTGWWRSPLNQACGGPIPAGSAVQFFQSPASSVQESVVRQAVQAFGNLQNVTWELMSSLDGADPVRIGYVSQFVQMLREIDTLDRLVSVSVARPKRTDSELYSLQGVDAVGFDWRDGEVPENSLGETISTLLRFGKPVVNHRAESPRGDLAAVSFERERVAIATAAGGCSIVRPESIFPDTAEWLRALIRAISEDEGKDRQLT